MCSNTFFFITRNQSVIMKQLTRNFRYTSQGDDKPTEASFQILENDEIVSYDYMYIQINFN